MLKLDPSVILKKSDKMELPGFPKHTTWGLGFCSMEDFWTNSNGFSMNTTGLSTYPFLCGLGYGAAVDSSLSESVSSSTALKNLIVAVLF